jgi:two-component system cell cycle sensor histidine kinase/response regulator CckA
MLIAHAVEGLRTFSLPGRVIVATIMVVDDDADVLDTLDNILSAVGHTVLRAANGVQALDILDRGGPIDLLLTDVLMPGLNGFNLARMVRRYRPRLPVLYLTGFFEQAQVMRDAGDKYGKLLMKPITPLELRGEVEAALT